MFKLRVIGRGINSRIRRMNSAADLVGQTVAVSEDDAPVVKSEVEAVKVNADKSVDIDLESGDQLTLTEEEAKDLVATGEVQAEDSSIEADRKENDDEPAVDEMPEEVIEPEEFQVARDVVDENGDVESIVTSTVSAADEDDAVAKVQLVDSKRGRNSRNYRIKNSRKSNSLGSISEVEKEVKSVLSNPKLHEPRKHDSNDNNPVSDIEFVGWMGNLRKVEAHLKNKGLLKYGKNGVDPSDETKIEEIMTKVLKELGYKVDNSANSPKISKNSRKSNSEPAGPTEEDLKKRDEILAKPQVNWTKDEQSYMSEKWGINCDVKEFKIARNCGKTRKIASVTAPSLEEAIEAVKAKDVEDKIQADGYEEMVDQLPQAATVVINSDVEEPIKDDTEDKKPEDKKDPEPEPKDDEDGERETNSFKGVADFVHRAYGIKL